MSQAAFPASFWGRRRLLGGSLIDRIGGTVYPRGTRGYWLDSSGRWASVRRSSTRTCLWDVIRTRQMATIASGVRLWRRRSTLAGSTLLCGLVTRGGFASASRTVGPGDLGSACATGIGGRGIARILLALAFFFLRLAFKVMRRRSTGPRA